MVRAFLIGAGATKAEFPNAPLSNDFFKKILNVNRPLYASLDRIFNPYIKRKLVNANIEDMMILCYNDFSDSQRESILANIYLAISEILSRFSFTGSITSPNRGPETSFKTLLRDSRISQQDFFITLNYDLYLDREIYTKLRGVDYGIDRKFISGQNFTLLDNPFHSIYHIHGSLNWEFKPKEKIYLQSSGVAPMYDMYGSNICLVPPGKKKINPILESIFIKAKNRLLTADELIIIGCSLNPDDKMLINIINKFDTKKGPGHVKIIHNEMSEEHINYKNFRNAVSSYENYPYGFNIEGPHGNPKDGAIEFIFGNTKYNAE